MLTRRLFLKLSALVGLWSVFPTPAFGKKPINGRREELIGLAESLLTEWCEGLLRYQIHKPQTPSKHGAIWSPGDRNLMGRCGDAVYPLLWCAKRHQDERFYRAAMNVMKWSLGNVAKPDGSWKNGPKQDWNGITVFIAIAMAQAILYHGDIVEEEIRNQLLGRLQLSAQWLYDTIDIDYSNINYPAANTYAMAILGKLFGEPRFSDRARELGQQFLGMFTPKDMLLHGEGRKNKDVVGGISPKGCYPVDLGYNVEESLPALAEYGLLQKDDDVLNKVVDSLRAHLEFMLPDGGWDNSWGTRNYKWTWWGSRTSDGCQPAYALLADRHPAFLEAAFRNTHLLKECTTKGVLFGGPDYAYRGIKPSLHHTFCHAKALASMLDGNIKVHSEPTSELPCEKEYGIRSFSDIATSLVTLGPWRGTITDYDFPYYWKPGHATGGALSLLWHRQVGPLLAASMTVYRPIERFDMQKEEGPGFEALTPRILLEVEPSWMEVVKDFIKRRDTENAWYTNIMDFKASVNAKSNGRRVIVKTVGYLVDEKTKHPDSGRVPYQVSYQFEDTRLILDISVEQMPEASTLTYILPIISRQLDPVEKETPKRISIEKGERRIFISADHDLNIPKDPHTRVFNYVPGYEALPVRIPFKDKLRITIDVV